MSHRFHRGGTYRSRDPLRRLNPMRQIPLFRTVESVFGPSPMMRAEAELRNAVAEVAGWTEMYAKACAALGTANRFPMTTRRYHQAAALRQINAARSGLRKAAKRVTAARVAVDALVASGAADAPWPPIPSAFVPQVAPACVATA
jgi:hypothetical protein